MMGLHMILNMSESDPTETTKVVAERDRTEVEAVKVQVERRWAKWRWGRLGGRLGGRTGGRLGCQGPDLPVTWRVAPNSELWVLGVESEVVSGLVGLVDGVEGR